jgi:FixJ family two-component response regulator
MDPMTGMVLLAHLCARSPQTRVIFITGREDHAAEVTVRQAGAFAFFVKPFDHTRFVAAVRDAFVHTSLRKEAVRPNELPQIATSMTAQKREGCCDSAVCY